MKKHVFIIGSKSVGQYGGFETFVNKLISHNSSEDIVYHVACKGNGAGCFDENQLTDIKPIDSGMNYGQEFRYKGAYLYKLPVPDIGAAVAVFYDVKALRYAIQYCKVHKIEKPDIYVLACRIGPFIKHYKRKIQRLGGRLFINPDGHEWMRKKWSKWIRMYWKFSERLMVKHADRLVCDSKNIEKYIQEEYKKYNPDTVYISYGAELSSSLLKDNDPAFVDWLNKWGLTPKEYFLVVGRLVPENNYAIMIREFLNSGINKKLVFITNNDWRALDKMKEEMGFKGDDHIVFTGSVYDEELLKKIRENAFAYLHGHEVGGTNPSLLEALSSTDLNLLLEVPFNEEVGKDAALYWTNDVGSLKGLLKDSLSLTNWEISEYRLKARKRILDSFNWDDVASKYADLFCNY